MGKPRRLNLTKEDRVLGVLPRDKRDLFAGCNEPGQPWFERDAHIFEKKHCRRCRNADCVRAKGSVGPWHTRMAEQVDFLLNDPAFSDLSTEEHKALAEMAFTDLRQRAERIEVARLRQDWEIPGGPTDGYQKVAPSEVTEQFDEAVRGLAEAKGKKAPDLERPVTSTVPAHFQESEIEDVSDSEYEYDTQFPSSEGTRTYLVALKKTGKWLCECEGFKHRQQCKHLDTVRAWYEEQLRLAEEQAKKTLEPTPAPPPAADPRVPVERPYNTPMPRGGVMVGGGEAPEPPLPPRLPPTGPQDPWTPSQDKVVQPGAVVTLKGNKKP